MRRTLLALLALALTLVAAACGGGGSSSETTNASTDATTAAATTVSSEDVPANAVAVVAGEPILRNDYQRVFDQYETAYTQQGQEFPKAGTPEYRQLQEDTISYLIDRALIAHEAESEGITVTDADVQKELDSFKDQYFQGDEAKYKEELEAQGLTDADMRADIRFRLLAQKLADKLTADVTVTDGEVKTYYDEHKDEFSEPESREVAHILVGTKKEADDLYQQLVDGADFAALAKEHSTDEGSAKDGGRLTDVRGSFVPEFEEVAFSLETGEVGKPVKSQFGWHVIKALADTTPGTTPPFGEVSKTIEDQLLSQKQDEALSKWLEDLRSKYAPSIAYAVGFAPVAESANTMSTTP